MDTRVRNCYSINSKWCLIQYTKVIYHCRVYCSPTPYLVYTYQLQKQNAVNRYSYIWYVFYVINKRVSQ